jgi:hypothetical protein
MGLQHSIKFNGGYMYNRSDIAYAAGVFDIHGSIKIITDKKDLTNSSLYIWITSKDAKLMKFLELFEAVIGPVSGGQFRAKWKDNKAYYLLKSMLPQLIIKKDQAEVGMEFYINKTNNTNPETYIMPLVTRLKLLKRDDLGE